jgi:ribosomal protein S18 acetylase RimI-like enzyme
VDGIRPATVADVEAIARLHVAAWQVAYRGLLPDDYLGGLDWEERAESRRAQLADQALGVRILVAEDDQAVVGFIAWGPVRDGGGPDGDVAEIYALYVDPRAWGRGHGRALIRQAVADLPPTGELVLWVLAANARARAFYERSGFAADGGTAMIEIGGAALPEVRYRYGGGQGARPPER